MKIRYGIVVLIMFFWFVISLITNILGPIIPDIIDSFDLERLALAGFIPSSFFVAYGIMSVPAGWLVERYGEKLVLSIGFLLPLIGSLLFALYPTYNILLVSCFTIGLGMSALQTSINPLNRRVVGEENFAFFAVVGQLMYGVGSFVAPNVYQFVVHQLDSGEVFSGAMGVLQSLTPINMPWVSLYWIFSALLFVTIIMVLAVRFPKHSGVQNNDDTNGAYRELLHNKYVYLCFFGIFSYVFVEQGVVNWMSEFLRTYHGLDPQSTGASVVGHWWAMMTAGCVVGLAVLKLWDSRAVLKVAVVLAITSLFTALYGSTDVAVVAFPMVGFSISLMFSISMSLGLNSVARFHGTLAGILCSGIIGGAVGPLVIGALGDVLGLRMALGFAVIPLAYIMLMAFVVKPLVNNKTVKLAELFCRKK